MEAQSLKCALSRVPKSVPEGQVRLVRDANHEKFLDPMAPSLFENLPAILSVGHKPIAIQRDPVSSVSRAMGAEPLLFAFASVKRRRRLARVTSNT